MDVAELSMYLEGVDPNSFTEESFEEASAQVNSIKGLDNEVRAMPSAMASLQLMFLLMCLSQASLPLSYLTAHNTTSTSCHIHPHRPSCSCTDYSNKPR